MNVLITGATSGIGEAFTYKYASLGFNLVIVARNKEKLFSLASIIKEKYKVEVHIVPADLNEKNSVDIIKETVDKFALSIDVLINNAGIGEKGLFGDITTAKINELINVNINSVVKMTHMFLPDMLKINSGVVINICSTLSFLPAPRTSIYGATKAFLLSFTEALHFEYKDQNIKFLAVCPGTTRTNFFNDSYGKESNGKKSKTREPIQVVNTALKALKKNKIYCIDGKLNYLMIFVTRFLPRKLNAYIAYKFVNK